MNKIAVSTILWSVLAAGPAAAAAPPVRPELERLRFMTAHTKQELSGLSMGPTGLWGVADDKADHFVFAVDLGKKGKRYKLEATIDLTKLAGFDGVSTAIAAETRVGEKDRRLDLEGIARCGDELYLVNERVRQVMVVDLKAKSIAKAPIDFSAYPDLFAGEANAGFEGVAADCATRTIYLAKERDPRRLLTVERATWTLVGDHDVAPSDRGGQKVINPFNGGQGLLTIGADFADLTFDGGFLYALERGTYEIAKIDPKTYQVVARVSYFLSEHGAYETGEPFAIAEALAMTKDEIYVGLDNNGTSVAPAAGKALGIKPGEGDRVGAIMVFKRPAGF
jgi:hypothetical protein